jgi:hypothetical protein
MSLPKADGILAPGIYRPVSLQNCSRLPTKLLIHRESHRSVRCAIFLSSGGRIVLLIAVLDALPTVCHRQLHRAFLGNATDRASGASTRCAARSRKVGCESSASRVTTKNECLQLKLVHRRCTGVDVSSPCWAWNSAAGNAAAAPRHPLEASLLSCPPL